MPEDQAAVLATEVENSIRDEWTKIANSVWAACENGKLWDLNTDLPKGDALKVRWDEQVEQFLNINWAATPLPATLGEIEKAHAAVPAPKVRAHYFTVKKAAETIRRLGHGDDRYFTPDGQLKNVGFAWALAVSLNGWELDAVRQTRTFPAKSQPVGDAPRQGQHFTKDSLTGKEEAVAGGEGWREADGELGHRFKHADFLSSPSLIKRLWDITYLQEEWNLERQRMPNTRSLAAGKPDEDDADDELPAGEGEKYFAVLAFDGDDMGKWVAGEKTPAFATQLASYEGGGALEYFQRPDHAAEFADFLETPRPLSPGYHLQFSECLSNFALRCARGIVEAYQGRLLYAGGDDVVALLPADTALACAHELRKAFCGEELSADVHHDLSQKAPGFLTSKDHLADGGVEIPFAVPGPKASASVGIAIAHFKSPLQDAVKTAQTAEKRAKKIPGKDAVAVTVLKRSGEITEWETRWAGGGVDLFQEIAHRLASGALSAKFPHRVCQLLEPYRVRRSDPSDPSDLSGLDSAELIAREFSFAITRQSEEGAATANEAALAPLLATYLAKLPQDLQSRLSAVTNLCTVAAFAHRTRS